MHVSLPTCPQAAYRCTHEYLLSVSMEAGGSLSAPTLSGGDCKQVLLRSLQQTARLDRNHSASGPVLRYSGIFLLSSVLTELPAGLSCSDVTKVAFKVKTSLNETLLMKRCMR